MLLRESSVAPEFSGSDAGVFGSFFSCAVDEAAHEIKIARNPRIKTAAKRSVFVFAELARKFEKKEFSLSMFNPSAEDLSGATSSSPPGRMFRIQLTRRLCNCPHGGWKALVPNR